MSKNVNKVSYLEWKGKYLIMNEKGKTIVLPSEEEFKKYLTKNNCKVIN